MKRWNTQLVRLHLLIFNKQKGPPNKENQSKCIWIL